MTAAKARRKGSGLKKIVVLAVAALALAVGIPSLALAEPGPSCADIVGGSGTYGSTGQVNLVLDLESAACSQFTYTYYVVTAEDPEGRAVSPIEQQTAEGDLLFQTNVNPETNETICVYATTAAGGGKHVFDRALDTGCFPIARSSSPGFTGFS